MPQQRRSPVRRRDRRSRSRSHSPRRRRRSHSSSRSRDRRRSRSPPRKRSPNRRHRSPPRKRSPSPKIHMKSRSRSPKRRTHYSSSPSDRGYPVKRPADSSGKRQGYRSRSPSPVVQKRSRDERHYREESPHDTHRLRRSRSPSDYGGKMYSDQPSSSKQPLFPAGSSRGKTEIDYVTIVEKGPKKEKLNKRFETLEQVAQGPFDFEENITIGIHRGPQHLHLHDDEDIEVNYEFNPKTFKMLFPKKEYLKAIFDRDEIKAFRHDDILDEEAYVEKRTISIKPVNKPKARKYGDEFDYKITVGSDKDGYGDRRMVHDSGSRSRSSRSSGYNDMPVTVRLDPKPDPRYEKMFKEQQRSEDQALIQEKIQRNPNDLRYNLMRRKSDGDRGDRQHDPIIQGTIDARSRIEARRESHGSNRRDRSAPERRSSPREDDRHRRGGRTDLPDFKNRPGVKLNKPRVWLIGSSVVKDIVKFGEKYPEFDLAERLKDDVESIEIHGENDMNIEDILAGVRFMLKKKELPQMIVFHCGEQDICTGKNMDLTEIMNRDLKIIRQEIPDVFLVFSQILPAWHSKGHTGSTLGKSRRRINSFMRQCFVNDEINGAFLYHPRLRTNMSHLHMPTRDQCLHLNKRGMEIYLYELISGIRYLISGHGSIFPYMKWPMNKAEMKAFEPFCMCMLNEEHIQSLTAERFSLFSEQQIKSLTNEQINMFRSRQCKFIFEEKVLSILSHSQLKSLKKGLFMNLSENTLKLFSDNSERMNCLNEDTRACIKERLAELEEKKNVKTEKSEQTIGDLINISDDSDVEIIDSDVESDIETTNDGYIDNLAREYVSAIQPSEILNTGRGRKSGYALRGRDKGRGQQEYSQDSYRSIDMDELKARGITRFSDKVRGRYNDRDRHRSDDNEHERYREDGRERYELSRIIGDSGKSHDRRERSRGRYGRNESEESEGQKYHEKVSRRSRDRHSRDSRSYSRDRYSSRSQSRSRSSDRYDSDDSSERERRRSREHKHQSRSPSKDHHHGYPHQGSPGLVTEPLPFCPQFNPGMPGMFPSGPPVMPMIFNPAAPFGIAPPMPFPVTPFGPFPPPVGNWPPAAPPVATVASNKVKNWGDFPTENDSIASVNTSNLKQIGSTSNSS